MKDSFESTERAWLTYSFCCAAMRDAVLDEFGPLYIDCLLGVIRITLIEKTARHHEMAARLQIRYCPYCGKHTEGIFGGFSAYRRAGD